MKSKVKNLSLKSALLSTGFLHVSDNEPVLSPFCSKERAAIKKAVILKLNFSVYRPEAKLTPWNKLFWNSIDFSSHWVIERYIPTFFFIKCHFCQTSILLFSAKRHCYLCKVHLLLLCHQQDTKEGSSFLMSFYKLIFVHCWWTVFCCWKCIFIIMFLCSKYPS